MPENSYKAVMARSNEIMKHAVGMDYAQFSRGRLAFDYQAMMTEAGYSLEEVVAVQRETGVGNTPLYELKNITALVRQAAAPGKGARIFLKDEAANPSGSFKARRAALSVYHAAKHGFQGVVAATSGNYGAAVASQAAMRGLKCIIIQEAFDSRGVYQPEIEEKGRPVKPTAPRSSSSRWGQNCSMFSYAPWRRRAFSTHRCTPPLPSPGLKPWAGKSSSNWIRNTRSSQIWWS